MHEKIRPLTGSEGGVRVAVGSIVEHQKALRGGYAVAPQSHEVAVAHTAEGVELGQKLALAHSLHPKEWRLAFVESLEVAGGFLGSNGKVLCGGFCQGVVEKRDCTEIRDPRWSTGA